jgi:hypothetical protein
MDLWRWWSMASHFSQASLHQVTKNPYSFDEKISTQKISTLGY